MQFGPAPHIKLAIVDGDLVLFDISQDAYLAVSRDDAANAICALQGGDHCVNDPVLAELLAQQLFLEAKQPWIASIHRHPQALPPASAPCRQLRLLFPFVRAAIGSWFALRKADSRWVSRPNFSGTDRAISTEQMAGIMSQFEAWRILVPGSGRCLVQSMILMRFLALLQIRAEWVFGVRTHPFEAHCWVEWRSYILNDSADHAGWYTAIARL